MRAITRLAMRLGIRDEIENRDMTRNEARAMIHALRKELRERGS